MMMVMVMTTVMMMMSMKVVVVVVVVVMMILMMLLLLMMMMMVVMTMFVVIIIIIFIIIINNIIIILITILPGCGPVNKMVFSDVVPLFPRKWRQYLSSCFSLSSYLSSCEDAKQNNARKGSIENMLTLRSRIREMLMDREIFNVRNLFP